MTIIANTSYSDTFEEFELRELNVSDAPAFYALVEKNRKRLEDFFAGTVAKTKTPEDTVDFIREALVKKENNAYFPFIVVDKIKNTPIGFIDVKNIDWNIPKAELGCYIDADYTGKSISHKALMKLIRHLFNEKGFNKLFLRTHAGNTAARALAEKCGFIIEGTLRSDYKTTKGELVDLLYYGLLKREK